MSPVIHCSIGNISLFSGTTFIQTKRIQFIKYNASHNHAKRVLFTKGYDFSHPSFHLPQIYRISFTPRHGLRSQTVSAVRTDVTVEDPNPAISGEGNDDAEGISPSSVETSQTVAPNPDVIPTARAKRPRSVRKSEMPPVKDEELIPGASFIGKVRSIQPFGAFVDFGAFTDGLVHVSRISNEYVKDVAAVVSIGQEVNVKVVEANKETGRISLTMRDGDSTNTTQQRKEAPASGSTDKPRSVRKNAARSSQKRDVGQKNTKLVKGQVLDGTVKNTIRSGAFVSLPDGEEGFLPVSEESEGFGNITGNSSLQVGQEVKVRVLRISRGQVTLTMKKEEDVESINRQLNQGVVHAATNPFELAFRQNKDIAAFLDQRERTLRKASLVIEEKVNESAIASEVGIVGVSSSSGLFDAAPSTISPSLVKQLREETAAGMMDCKKALAETDGDIVKAMEFLRKKGLASADKKASRATAEGRIGSYIHNNRIRVLFEVNCETDFVSRGEIFQQIVEDLAMQVVACPQVRYLVPEDVPDEIVNKEREMEMQKEDLLLKPEQIRSKIVDGHIKKRLAEFALLEQPYIRNDKMVVKDWVKQTIATVGENIKVKRFVRYNLGEGLEKKGQDFATEVAAQTTAKPSLSVPKDQSAEERIIVEK